MPPESPVSKFCEPIKCFQYSFLDALLAGRRSTEGPKLFPEDSSVQNTVVAIGYRIQIMYMHFKLLYCTLLLLLLLLLGKDKGKRCTLLATKGWIITARNTKRLNLYYYYYYYYHYYYYYYYYQYCCCCCRCL